jgi:hypothetical protein
MRRTPFRRAMLLQYREYATSCGEWSVRVKQIHRPQRHTENAVTSPPAKRVGVGVSSWQEGRNIRTRASRCAGDGLPLNLINLSCYGTKLELSSAVHVPPRPVGLDQRQKALGHRSLMFMPVGGGGRIAASELAHCSSLFPAGDAAHRAPQFI